MFYPASVVKVQN